MLYAHNCMACLLQMHSSLFSSLDLLCGAPNQQTTNAASSLTSRTSQEKKADTSEERCLAVGADLSHWMLKCWICEEVPAALLPAMSLASDPLSVQSMTVGLCSTNCCSLCTSSLVVALIRRHWQVRGICMQSALFHSFMLELTVWGVEPCVAQQTSWLESTALFPILFMLFQFAALHVAASSVVKHQGCG